MITKDPKMQKWLDDNPSVLENQYALVQRQEEDRWVSDINGDRILVKELTRDHHNDIKIIRKDVCEIKSAVEIFIDFNKIYRIFKKWKKTRLIVFLISVGSIIYGILR